MDMSILFEKFKEHVDAMDDDAVRDSIRDAEEHTSDLDKMVRIDRMRKTMEKDELRKLIKETDDENILAALWELYDKKNTVTVEKIIYKETPSYFPNTVNNPWAPQVYY